MLRMDAFFRHPLNHLNHASHAAQDCISGVSNRLFDSLSSLFALLRAFFAKETSSPNMSEKVAVKNSIEIPPVKLMDLAPEETSNPLKDLMTALATQKIVASLPPAPALLITTILKHLSVENLSWNNGTRTALLEVALNDAIQGHLSILPPTPTAFAGTTSPTEIHTFLHNTLKKNKVDPKLIETLLKDLPTSSATFSWSGLSQTLTLEVNLPHAAKVKLDLGISPDKILELFPTLKEFVPPEAQDLLQTFKPLIGQTFSLTWDGKTSKMNLSFDLPQQLEINEVQIKKIGFLRTLVRGLTKNIQVEIPQNIQVHVDLKTLQLSFGSKTSFKIRKGLFSKKVALDTIGFDPVKKAIDINLQCFGKHAIHLDLTQSNIDTVDLGVRPIS